MNWHTRLTQARTAKNIKKIHFARMVGVSPATITQWETGVTKEIKGENLTRVCRILGISPGWLLHKEGEVEPPKVDQAISRIDHIQRVDAREADLLDIWRSTDEDGKGTIMRAAESVLKVGFLGVIDNKK